MPIFCPRWLTVFTVCCLWRAPRWGQRTGTGPLDLYIVYSCIQVSLTYTLLCVTVSKPHTPHRTHTTHTQHFLPPPLPPPLSLSPTHTTPYTLDSTQYTVHSTQYTVHSAQCTVHIALLVACVVARAGRSTTDITLCCVCTVCAARFQRFEDCFNFL